MTEYPLEQAVRRFYLDENHNCAETLLAACNEVYHLGLSKDSIRLVGGFGRGLYTGNVCGALAGCTAALSSLLIETKAHECEALPKAQQFLIRSFRSELGDTQCARLRPVHFSEESRCLKTCLHAAAAMEKTVDELKRQNVLPDHL